MLTKRQKQILDYIKEYIKKNDYAPTLEEIKKHFRLSSLSTVHQHLENLEAKGYLIRLENQPRSIQLIRKKRANFLEVVEDSNNIEISQNQLLPSSVDELNENIILKKQERLQKNELPLKRNKKLDIPFKKICNCPSNHINCLNAKRWMKYQVAIWEFSYEKRDIRDKSIHPAVFPIALPARCIELFTHRGELVLDPFVGTGTTLVAARDLERNAVGFDLNKKYIDFANKRLSQVPLFSKTRQIAICDDAINIPNYLEENTVSLSVTSPPYANMLNRPRENKSLRGDLRNNQYYKKIQQYSQNPRDLGTMNPKKFAEALGEIYKRILPLHKPRAHCVINIADLWWNNKRIPLHLYVIEALEKAGYELRNIIIWDRRNLVNNAGIFGWPSNYITLSTTFEYILDFWRPK